MSNGGGGDCEWKSLPLSKGDQTAKRGSASQQENGPRTGRSESQKCTPRSLTKVGKDAESHQESEKHKLTNNKLSFPLLKTLIIPSAREDMVKGAHLHLLKCILATSI